MKKVCSTCQSENVVADASVSWNDEIQKWEVETVFFNNAYCHSCKKNTYIDDIEDK
mgnify:CR=1 FL=1